MSAKSSAVRNPQLVALAAVMLSALTVSASARDGTPIHHPMYDEPTFHCSVSGFYRLFKQLFPRKVQR